MQGIEETVTEHALTALLIGWLVVNVLVGLIAHRLHRQSMRRHRAGAMADRTATLAHHARTVQLLNEDVADAERNRAVSDAQLRGYRDAVRTLTQHPTTVVVGAQHATQVQREGDAWRTAAREGREAPTEQLDRESMVTAVIEESRVRLASEVDSLLEAARHGHAV